MPRRRQPLERRSTANRRQPRAAAPRVVRPEPIAPASSCEPSAEFAARDALVLAHSDLVRQVAQRVGRRLPPHVDRSDLVGVGMIGLIEAATRFRPSTGVPFEAFARRRVHGAILDSLRELDWMPRSVRAMERQAAAAASSLRQELGREPSKDEIADRLGMSPTNAIVNRALDETTPGEPRQDTLRTLEQCPDPSETVEEQLLRAELSLQLHREVRRLPEREQQILDSYYQHERTMGEIGAVLGVCESRVSQLRSAAIARLRVTLAATLGLATAALARQTAWKPVLLAGGADANPRVLPTRMDREEVRACQAA